MKTTIELSTTNLLLLAMVPFLLVCATFMVVGLFTGPRTGGFKMILPWSWLWLVLPTILAGLVGIVRALGAL
jgi:hypothetical protein